MKEMKRILALVLCFVMLAGYLPVNAFATDAESSLVESVQDHTDENVLGNEEQTPADEGKTEEESSDEIETEEESFDEIETEKQEIIEDQPAVDTTTVQDAVVAPAESDPNAGIALTSGDELIEEQATYATVDIPSGYTAAAVFASDIHGSTSDTSSVMDGVASSGVSYNAAVLVGDTFSDSDSNSSTITSAVQTELGTNVNCYYSWGDHDYKSDIEDYTGLLNDGSEGYYVYAISMSAMTDMSDSKTGRGSTYSEDLLTAFSNAVEGMDKTKPLFIATHMPLHARRGDNTYANNWYGVISAAAEKMDVVVFWAHNHTSENEVDRAAYYVAKGGTEKITIEGGSAVIPNFTYMNAGYINAANQNPSRKGVATAVMVYADSILFQDYNSGGAYTDSSYSHNVSVARKVASGSTTPTVNTVNCMGTNSNGEANTDAITATGTGLTAVTAVWPDDADLAGFDTKETVYYDITLEGYTTGDTVTLSFNILEMTTDNLQVYSVDGENKTEITDAKIVANEDGSVTVTVSQTAATGTYIIGKQGTIADGTVIELTVDKEPTITSYTLLDSIDGKMYLDITGLEVTATYATGETATVYWDQFDDANDGYALSFDMSQIGPQDVKITYGGQETSFSITVYANTATVLSNEEFVSDELETLLAEGYVARDIKLTDYTEGTVRVVMTASDGADTVYHVDEEGKCTEIDDAIFKNGVVAFDAPHFSNYVVGTSTLNGTESGATIPGQTGESTYTYEEVTVYKLVSTPNSGKQYLIVNSAQGTGYGLDGDTTGYATTKFTGGSDYYSTWNGTPDDSTAFSTGSDVYLTTESAYLWAAGSNSFAIGYDSDGSVGTLVTNYTYTLNPANGTSDTWTLSGNKLSISLVTTDSWFGSDTNSTYYLTNSDSSWSMATGSGSNVYFYEPVTVYKVTETTTGTPDVTYNMYITYPDSTGAYVDTQQAIKAIGVEKDEKLQLGAQFTANGTNCDVPANGTWAIKSSNTTVATVDNTGLVTFTGAEGETLIQATYTWTVGDASYSVSNYVAIEVAAATYTLDLHQANVTYTPVTGEFDSTATYFIQKDDGTYEKVTITAFEDGVTYYTLSYTLGAEITDTISIKGINAGDRYGVWAVVKEFDGTSEEGTDIGAAGDDIVWTSSDTSIATVNSTTGVITFTGKDGTVQITATYQKGNKPVDTITISVTTTQYTVPADGTTDFPEYPNEGAIRYDKTATAVGNFSETGIAQVELSMTGVPYTTGSELDVVLMLDQSTSMDDDRISATVAATKAFIESIVINEDGTYNSNRIYVGYFNGTSTYDITDSNNIGGDLATVDNKTELDALFDDIDDEFDGSPSTSGTDYATSLAKCYSRLNTAKTDGTGNNRQQFCVFMSDGVPTHYQISATEYYGGSSSSSGGGFNVSEITAMFTGTNYDTRDTDYIYEYYSTQMKKNNVTIYTVGLGLNAKNNAWSSATATQCLNAASILLNDISGPAGETTQPDAKSTKTLSKKDSYFFSVEDSTAATDMKKVFQNIAMKILQAATDVTVEDKITDEYTMIFDIPEGTNEITGVTNDFYIEFLEYTLNATTHERVDSDNDGNTYEEAKSITKLYLKNTNGVYSAAKDSSGTAYDKPVFENKTIGDKGTLYYWTTDSNYSQKAAVSYTTDSTTYYFIPYGIKATDDGYDSTKWFNMTSGAYAYGTIENYGTEDSTNMSTNLVIATPYFVYNAGTKMIYWTVDKIGTTEYALRYFLYLDKSATEVGTDNETDPGSYPTNVHAYITYTNFKGNGCRQEFPKPQLTWSGAQVSYVFYLVNAAGQPINKSGQVVDFANATFVTDVYTEKTVWNKGEDGKITADSELDINWLAANLLPSDYKVYDEQALYQLHVYGNHDGTSYFDYFTIGGNDAATISSSLNNRLVNVNTTASTVSLTTTKVYNTKAGTKITGYGTYTSKATDSLTNETVLSNFDFYNTTVAFAVVWQPALAPDTVVVDYGLDVLINVTFNDLMQDNTISGIGLSREAYGTIAENTGISTNTVLGTADLTVADGSTISIEPNKVQIRFSQNDMTFEEPVKFYYESAVKYYESSQQKDGYLHSSVTVIPATTIYYEDEFVDLTTYTLIVDEAGKAVLDADGKKQYTATPSWTTVYNDGMTAGATATQAQDRPGTTLITGVVDANNNYGYDGAYAAMSQYSMGSAAKVNVYDGKYAKASFEFYGTGFDVISLTDTTTGYILVDIYEQDASNNWVLNNTYYSSVDTYYGYAYGDQDGDGTSEWYTVDSNSPNALYQVPVIKMTGMDYDHYKAEITVSYMSFMDHTDENGYDFYLDAIRIYDPTGNNNTTANNAYKADGEGWPTYFEVRNQIIEKNTFDSLNDENVSGIVFIDSDTSVNQAEIANYISYGPNNEVYLTANQAIAFDLNATAAAGSVAKVQLAVKTVGGTGKVEVYGVENSTKVDCLDETISTATDMYYDITALNNKTVVIKNTGSGDSSAIISITNVKVTYTEAQPAATEPAVAMFSIRRSTADAALATLNVEEDTTPEPSVPETSEPEASEPETSVPETTVPEITEPEETEPETAVPEETEPEYDREQVEEAIKEAVQTVVNTVVNALKNIFGRWFR